MSDDLEIRLRAAIHAEARSVDAADPGELGEDASLPAIWAGRRAGCRPAAPTRPGRPR